MSKRLFVTKFVSLGQLADEIKVILQTYLF